MQYLDYSDRKEDSQYRDLITRIFKSGMHVESLHGPALMVMQHTMQFDLANGFPMITERSLRGFWRKPIGELCAFINGATTLTEFEKFGCDWWRPWASPARTIPLGIEAGDLGPWSYGGAFRRFPLGCGLYVDQFKELVNHLQDEPNARTMFITPWIPQYQRGRTRQTTVAPCHGWVHVRVIRDRLHLHMFQRAADVPIGLPGNMAQYGALLLMLEQLTGYEAASYYHTISDAHIYLEQVRHAKIMQARSLVRLPTVRLNDAGLRVRDIHDFRPSHFELTDYHPHPPMTDIPVSI